MRFRRTGWFRLKTRPAGWPSLSGGQVLVSRRDLEKFSSPLVQRLVANGVKSGVVAPLIIHGRVIGTLALASLKDGAFTEADAELLTRIAGQIAIAVENALNFERASQAEQEIRHQFERERLMLEINNAVVSELSLRELVRVISTSIREVMDYDTASVGLYDPETNQLRAYLFDQPDSLPPIEEGTLIPLEGTVGGLAISSGRPAFIRRTDLNRATNDFDRRLIEAGIKSGGCVPLLAHDRMLGVLGVGEFSRGRFLGRRSGIARPYRQSNRHRRGKRPGLS